MADKEPDKRKIWAAPLERPVFDISGDRPISALHYHWRNRQHLRYDMHYGLELGILLEGKMRRHFGAASFDVASGGSWLCGMWEPHGYQITRVPCEAVVLIIFPPVLAEARLAPKHNLRLLAPFEANPESRPAVPPSLKKKAISLAGDIKSIINDKPKNKDTWLNLKLIETLLMLMDNWDPPKIPGGDLLSPAANINKAINLVFENRRFVSTQEAAGICGMNRNAFGKRFRDSMGITFSEFALRYRISAAAEQILKSNDPLKKIASDWGFTDTSHLHHCLQKYYKCSPTKYRNTAKRIS